MSYLLLQPCRLVTMGVAGCGKSTLGAKVAEALGLEFVEGDDFHSKASQDKMRHGIPLEDADRIGWLDAVARELNARPAGAVVTCSSLKRAYRERLRSQVPALRFAFLDISEALALERVAARAAHHLFPPSLVPSQFAALERPTGEPGVLTLDGALPLARLQQQVLQWLQAEGVAREQ
ncbi:gluconokinase [Ideonella sp. BN130291]|uniref:gluconokinase n=1 Tax=Ideonella sp. BN130291 TaxID=3112940 RepID=UPI002E271855|nr:gluconokinase [Ideonella sp. BN130291]